MSISYSSFSCKADESTLKKDIKNSYVFLGRRGFENIFFCQGGIGCNEESNLGDNINGFFVFSQRNIISMRRADVYCFADNEEAEYANTRAGDEKLLFSGKETKRSLYVSFLNSNRRILNDKNLNDERIKLLQKEVSYLLKHI